MTPEQFCYWLQGFAELHDEPPPPCTLLALRGERFGHLRIAREGPGFALVSLDATRAVLYLVHHSRSVDAGLWGAPRLV